MATTEGSTIQRNNTYITTCGFIGGTTEVSAEVYGSPDASGTSVLATVVPADGAELVAMTFTVTSNATTTTSGTQQWSISDGTNALATLAATGVGGAGTAAGTVLSMVMGTATNGKNLATTAGSRLTLTNTEVGTIGDGVHGVFRLVWAL